MNKINKVVCENCGHKWSTPPDVIDFHPLCEMCTRANTLHWQIFHIVGQDGAIAQNYNLIIHPEVFKKFRLIKEFSSRPGKYNKTHIYKRNGKYGIKLQQRFFFGVGTIKDPKRDSELIFHNVNVILNKKIFWWYMEKVK